MTLQQFFTCQPNIALAFSGGVDSAYLLYAAIRAGARIKAYYVKTPFQPQFEYEDALILASQLGADMQVINLDVLADPEISANRADRCYYCKHKIFSAIAQAAKADGFDTIIDGTNASDDASDRPGMKALQDLKVRSPLRECGLTKQQIRGLSKEAGLFTHDKPAYACLATRIPTGVAISKEMLERTEKAEDSLKTMGFTDFRIRLLGNSARIQVPEAQISLLIENRKAILKELKQYYGAVLLDLEVRQP